MAKLTQLKPPDWASGKSSEQRRIESFARTHIENKKFTGTFLETRYVDCIGSYLNVIEVFKDERSLELLSTLNTLRELIKINFRKDFFMSYTTNSRAEAPPHGNCMWATLPEELFGTFVYRVRKIQFYPNLMLIAVKPVKAVKAVRNNARLISGDSGYSSLSFKANQSSDGDSSVFTTSENCSLCSGPPFTERLKILKRQMSDNFFAALTALTAKNIGNVLKFFFLLIFTIVVGLLKCAEFLGNFTLRLIHESSNLITAITPIVLGVLDMITKMIGGLYLLILGMWRESRRPTAVAQPQGHYYQKPEIDYYPRYYDKVNKNF